jgi:predicted GH43/DUF377 family glycosyl hydrolase
MLLKRHPKNPILEKNSENHWEAGSVFNPGILFEDGIFKMFYRATNDIKINKTGGYISSIGYAESKDGINFKRFDKPLISPDQAYEQGLGCEDARVTKINGKYHMFYTAVGKDRKAMLAYATSTNLKQWKKHGLLFSDVRSKAAVLFPEKINNKYVMFYTITPDRPTSSIMKIEFDSLDEIYKNEKKFMDNLSHFEDNSVFPPPVNTYRGAEVGAVPIKTDLGWLFIYCPANTTDHKEWRINAALLELKNPQNILADIEILKPETKEEKTGVVKNVTFPEGAVVFGKKLYVYYGSGDQGVCLATCNLKMLLEKLEKNSNPLSLKKFSDLPKTFKRS